MVKLSIMAGKPANFSFRLEAGDLSPYAVWATLQNSVGISQATVSEGHGITRNPTEFIVSFTGTQTQGLVAGTAKLVLQLRQVGEQPIQKVVDLVVYPDLIPTAL